MKQVLVKGGSVTVEEVPAPSVEPGTAVVRVAASLISSGTESGFLSEGGTTGYLLKKAGDPLNIEKVKRKLATVGVKGTLELVRNKLLEFQAPGYSTAGVIVELGPIRPCSASATGSPAPAWAMPATRNTTWCPINC